MAGVKTANFLFYCSFYKLARLVLCIRRQRMIPTNKSAVLDPLDKTELAILGLTDAHFVRSHLMTQSEVCATTRKV